jgi:hypothetical protein
MVVNILLSILLAWHCKEVGGCCKLKTYKENKTMIFVMSLVYQITVTISWLIVGLSEFLISTFMISRSFMQSIIFLRLCQYFVHVGLSNFSENEAKTWKCAMKTLMILSYLFYFAFAIYRIVKEVDLVHDQICIQPVFIFLGVVNCLISITFMIMGCRLNTFYKRALDVDDKHIGT